MIVVETGLLWRRVAARFEKRVNELAAKGYQACCVHCEHRFLGLRVIFYCTLTKPENCGHK